MASFYRLSTCLVLIDLIKLKDFQSIRIFFPQFEEFVPYGVVYEHVFVYRVHKNMRNKETDYVHSSMCSDLI